jgi:hypothetical protein
MAQLRRNISRLLLLAVFVSSFCLSANTGEKNDNRANLGARVGASHTPQTDVGDCRKECESCFTRERTCEFDNVRLNAADIFPRHLSRPSSNWAASSSLGASSSAAFVATIRIQI